MKTLPKYVYIHTDVNSGDTIYVGVGTGERAWEWRSNKRSKEHNDILRTYLEQGYTPSDWVSIVESNLSSEQAVNLETKLIELYTSKFNKCKNPDYISDLWKFTEVHWFAKALQQMGHSYSNIAFLMGGDKSNSMSAWRMVNAY